MINIKHCFVLFLLSWLLLISTTIMAEEDSQSAWSLKGFGTFAATGTDTDNIGFYRDQSQSQDVTNHWSITSDSRLGLQLDWRATDSLQAAVQWVARDHVGNFFEQNLDWAFLRWQLPKELDIRVGRLGSDFVLMSDYRNIGYVYPWMRPPHEFYANIPFYHFDGMDVAKKFSSNDGYLTFKAFGGYMHNEISSHLSGLTLQNSVVAGGNVRYETDNWQWFLGYAYVQIVSELPNQPLKKFITNSAFSRSWSNQPQLLPSLPIKGSQFHYNDLGFIYDDGVWLSQSELAYVSSNTSWIHSKILAYSSLGRRFSNLTVYSLFGIVRSFDHNAIKVPAPLVPSPVLLSYQ
jgi:hypothetical protein